MDTIQPIDKIIKILILLFLFVLALYYAAGILIPISIAALASLLFLPLVKRLENKIGQISSILICLLLIVVLLLIISYLFYSQLISFVDNITLLENRASIKFHKVLKLIESATKIPSEEQKKWLSQMNHRLASKNWIENFFYGTSYLLINLGLVIVYIFCFLFYRKKILHFFISFSKKNSEDVRTVILKIKELTSSYFLGVLMVMLILGTMHSIGLLLLGIDHAIFLGYLAGMFILVPVVGTMVGSTIPFVIALITKDSIWYAVGVAGIFSFNLFIESQLLTPIIVGSKIKINPMMIIISIVIGGYIWGIAGMVLFIPLVGIVKILSDNFESLEPLKVLLSDKREESSINIIDNFKKWLKK